MPTTRSAAAALSLSLSLSVSLCVHLGLRDLGFGVRVYHSKTEKIALVLRRYSFGPRESSGKALGIY
jgi:hypothetical protein